MATLAVLSIWGLLILILYAVGKSEEAALSPLPAPPAELALRTEERTLEEKRRDLERTFPWDLLPLDEEVQNHLLTALRRAFLLVELEDYQFFLGKCRCAARDMPPRESFFRRLAEMLSRHVRFAPAITQYPVLREIALEMASAGSPVLKTGSENILKRFGDMEKSLMRFREPIRIKEPSGIALIPSFAASAPASPPSLKAWIQEVDRHWELEGRLDAFTAFLYEALEEVPVAEMKFATLNLQMLKGFFDDLRQGLEGKGAADWLGYLAANQDRWLGEISGIARELIDLANLSSGLEGRIACLEAFLAKGRYTAKDLEEMLFLVSRNQDAKEISRLLLGRTRGSPDAMDGLRLLGEWYLFSNQAMQAIVVFAWGVAWRPSQVELIWGLARSYQKLYLKDQVDVCVEALRRLEGDQAGQTGQSRLLLSEIIFRCQGGDAQVFLDDNLLGVCPVNVQGIPPGRHRVEWRVPGLDPLGRDIEVEDGWLYILRYDVVTQELTVDQTRDGMDTLLSDDDAGRLRGLLRDYLVADLGLLPKPSFADACRLFLETPPSKI